MIQSALLADISPIAHAFGHRQSLTPEVLCDFESARPQKQQVHGTRIVTVDQPAQACGHADGFLTDRPGIPVSIVTADCLPILFAHRSGTCIGALHAGWRGLLDGIIEAMLARIQAQPRGNLSEWLAVVGPAAGAHAYEVSETLIEQFRASLPIPAEIMSPLPRHLALGAIACHKLAAAGVGEIEHIDQCTITTLVDGSTGPLDGSDPDAYRFQSHRRHTLTHPDPEQRPRLPNQHSGLIILP
ncbi:polyphenol oxidase family protein [Kushneria phyllosphaerae]|uniref:Laccase domain protein YfiH n=1 Tax=Kushneria phyllosphaerae TaxID=2100822 RepID=A0A2R8CI69_9GAMM|nr:polyphenol oxidase family protein [Kushneria phyllosphaerae]SPJ32573.1 Laccase domain protein YfiH [Kushneria phyllosphaerae]